MSLFDQSILRACSVATAVLLTVAIGSESSLLAAATPMEPERVIYVSPEGDDDAEGTEDAPRRSVQKALDEAGPGDVVRLMPGVHRERVSFTNSGEHGNPVVLEGMDGAVLDGSDEVELEWELAEDVAPGVYRTPLSVNARTVAVDGKLLMMMNESRVTGDGPEDEQWRWTSLFRDGVRGRWEGVRALGLHRKDEQMFYVRFENELDPREMTFAFAPDRPVVHIDGVDRCVVRNLEVRNGWHGVRIDDSLGSVVEHCTIKQADHGVWMDEGADRCTVRFNTITQSPLSVYDHRNPETRDLAWDTWLAAKRAGYWGGQGVLMRRTEGGHQIHDNYIHDHWDGIQDRHWEKVQTPAEVRAGELARFNQNLNIHHNRIERTNDDALEPNSAEVNNRWHHNLVIQARCAVRVKTVDVGPLYIHHNLFIDNGEDIRFFGSLELNPAEVYIYHNSTTSFAALVSNKIANIGTPNYHVFNNLFLANYWWKASGDPVEPNWQGDYNVYVRRGDDDRWDSGRELSEQRGLDENSRWIEDGESPYADVDARDLSLTEQSPARGAGTDLRSRFDRTLPGLDDEASDAPDVGALSYGESMPTIPRDPASVDAPPAGSWPAAD